MSMTAQQNALELNQAIRKAQIRALFDPRFASLEKSTFSQSASATSGLTYYDLEAGAKLLFPVLTPLRNSIPRVSGNSRDTWARLSRRVKLWNDVAPADQPALFIGEHGESIAYAGDNFPSKTTLNVDLLIYTSAGRDPDAVPARALNIVIEALIATLTPDPKTGRQTLGGLVQSCRVEGRIEQLAIWTGRALRWSRKNS